MKKILFALPILCLSSCFFISDLDNTTNHVYFKNETAHEIAVLSYYTKDSTLWIDTFNVAPGSTLEKGTWDTGWGDELEFLSAVAKNGDRYNCDSTQVIFDANYHVSHYLIAPANVASKYYGISSQRNVFNGSSYDHSYKDRKKRHSEATYTYTFTDSDYVYATQ